MNRPALTSTESRILLGLAVFGLLVPNGIFIWHVFFGMDRILEALSNPVSLVFILEAFALMFLGAWWIARTGGKKPGPAGFVAWSLIGGLVFSVPLAIRRMFGRE